MNSEFAIEALNHASFAILSASLLVRQRYLLHIMSAVSGVLGISFMYLRHIESSVWWLTLLLVINIVQFGRYVWASTEVTLSEKDKRLVAKAFPDMRSRAFQTLKKHACVHAYEHGKILLSVGAHTTGLTMVASGRVRELRSNGHEMVLDCGRFWGEATLVSKSNYGGSAVILVAAEGGCEVYHWDYATLEKVFEADPELKSALMLGVAGGIVRKAHLLLPDAENELGAMEVNLTTPMRRIHALTAPRMSTLELSRWVGMASMRQIGAGKIIETQGDLYVIVRGEADALRSDGHHFTLSDGSFIGELGLCKATTDNRVPVEVKTTRETVVYHWRHSQIEALRACDPPLYGAIMMAVAMDIATKLARPLQPVTIPRTITHGWPVVGHHSTVMQA